MLGADLGVNWDSRMGDGGGVVGGMGKGHAVLQGAGSRRHRRGCRRRAVGRQLARQGQSLRRVGGNEGPHCLAIGVCTAPRGADHCCPIRGIKQRHVGEDRPRLGRRAEVAAARRRHVRHGFPAVSLALAARHVM